MFLLGSSFFITAALYATIGFGGGSTYTALLSMSNVDYQILPIIALFCNLIVVSGGTYCFYRRGYINLRRIAPWIITSVPAALIGGYINISEVFFIGLLGFSLLLSGLRMMMIKDVLQQSIKINRSKILPLIIGTALGLVAGMVGIGGGIFLAPILYLLRWGNAKEIAAACSVFILVNSLSGLIGQAIKLSNEQIIYSLDSYLLLFPAVLIGGQIGSLMSSKILDPKIINRMTIILILYVSARLIWRWIGMVI